MTADILRKLYNSYSQYYSLKRENVTAPFDAEAEFRSHTEQYVLVKAAKIADIDSNEFVYFYSSAELSFQQLNELAQLAWKKGLERVKAGPDHRNTDITLILIAENADKEIKAKIKKLNFYKSYKFGFWGWSSFRLCLYEASSKKSYVNRYGKDLRKMFVKINKQIISQEENIK